MAGRVTSPRILFPRTIPEALEYSGSESDAVFWAGGTRFAGSVSRGNDLMTLPRVVIALTLVEELARASRSENSLEIGAMMSLDRLALIGANALPPGLPEVLAGIGTRPLRCRATLGGNIGPGERRGDLLPLLQLLDAKVEIRYLRERRRRKATPSIRRIPLMVVEEENGLRRGDLITRISIPTGKWNFSCIEKLQPSAEGRPELMFQSVARVEKQTLVDWRMVFWDGRGSLVRNRDIEVALAGSSLPLSGRALQDLDEAILSATAVWEERKEDRRTAVSLGRSFMRRAAG